MAPARRVSLYSDIEEDESTAGLKEPAAKPTAGRQSNTSVSRRTGCEPTSHRSEPPDSTGCVHMNVEQLPSGPKPLSFTRPDGVSAHAVERRQGTERTPGSRTRAD